MFTFSSQDYKSNEHQNRMQLDHRNRKKNQIKKVMQQFEWLKVII